MSKVFADAGATNIHPDVANIIMVVIQLIGTFCANLLIDRIGRKPLFIFATVNVTIGMIAFGISTQLIEHGGSSTFLKLVPIFALTWSLFVANVGMFSLTFVILSEITPEIVSTTI